MPPSGVEPFRYHQDPLATGSAEPSAAACQICTRTTGFRYTGPIYSRAEEIEDVCLDCIRDGSAAARLGEALGPGGPFTSVDDATAHLGPAGYAELQVLDDALGAIRAECRQMRMPEGQVEDYLRWLHVDGDGDRVPVSLPALRNPSGVGRHVVTGGRFGTAVHVAVP